MNRQKLFFNPVLASGEVVPSPVVNEVSLDAKVQQLLDYIYTRSEDGRLTGDLAVFLNEKANKEVREFIQTNLHKRLSSSDTDIPPVLQSRFHELTDDDLAEFSINDGESIEDYGKRLRDYIDTERMKSRYLKKKAEYDKKHRLTNGGSN